MPWEKHVGKTRRTDPILIDRQKIQAFARGIAERDPRHVEPGHPEYSAPPLTVATVLIPATGMMLVSLDLGDDISRVVHGGIELGFVRPVREGDALSCVATFQGMEEKRSGRVYSFGFSVRDAQDLAVSEGVTQYFIRGEKKGEGRASEGETAPPSWEATEVVPEGQSLLYAEGSGDHFPIHTDPEFARGVGLPDVILHGMCTLGFASRAIVQRRLGGDSARLARIGVRFAKMVFHGDALTTRVWEDGDRLRFVTVNGKGQNVLDEGFAVLR